MCRFLFRKKIGELPSPKVRIPGQDISYAAEDNTIVIKLPMKYQGRVWLTTVQDTHSMEPLIDYECTIALVEFDKLKDLADLKVGDVIYWKLWGKLGNTVQQISAMHSIVEIGEDKDGWYCRTKGLNPDIKRDPWKIRVEHITHFLISIPGVGGNK